MWNKKKEGRYAFHARSLKWSWIIITLLLLFFCFLFYTFGLRQKQFLNTYAGTTTLLLSESSSYTYENAAEIRRINENLEEPFEYTMWGIDRNVFLENPNLNKSIETEIMFVEGSSGLACSSTVFLDETMEAVCLLGRNTAADLFGTSDVVGMSVQMDGRDYKVIGMLTDETVDAVFQAKDLPEKNLTRVNVVNFGQGKLSTLEQQLSLQLGISGNGLDYQGMNDLLVLPAYGLWILIGLWVFRLLLKEIKGFKQTYPRNPAYWNHGLYIEPYYIRGVVFRAGLLVGFIILLLIMLRYQVQVREDMIPAKWSDFALWSQIIKEKFGCLQQWVRCGKDGIELSYQQNYIKTTIYFVLTYIFYVAFRCSLTQIQHKKSESEK